MNSRILLIAFFISHTIFSQQMQKDSVIVKKITYKELIIPALLIGYGVIGIESDGIKNLNAEIKEEVNENIDKKFTIDDTSQFVPAVSVYALNAVGIKGKNNFKDRSLILATSYLLVAGTWRVRERDAASVGARRDTQRSRQPALAPRARGVDPTQLQLGVFDRARVPSSSRVDAAQLPLGLGDRAFDIVHRWRRPCA